MKNLCIKGASVFAFAFAAQSAFAAPVTITSTATSGPKILSTSVATISPAPIITGTLNVSRVNGRFPSITADGGAMASIGFSKNGITGATSFSAISFSMPVTSMTYEAADQSILGDTLQGGIKIVVEQNPSAIFMGGGELTIKDMRVDHATKTIYATLVGANGVGVRQNVPFWSYTAAIGNTTFPGGNVQTTLTPIRLTTDGLNAWAQSLGLTQDGKRSLMSINSSTTGFGSIVIPVNTAGTATPGTTTPPQDPSCKTP
jgi:hypothetical protein